MCKGSAAIQKAGPKKRLLCPGSLHSPPSPHSRRLFCIGRSLTESIRQSDKDLPRVQQVMARRRGRSKQEGVKKRKKRSRNPSRFQGSLLCHPCSKRGGGGGEGGFGFHITTCARERRRGTRDWLCLPPKKARGVEIRTQKPWAGLSVGLLRASPSLRASSREGRPRLWRLRSKEKGAKSAEALSRSRSSSPALH